MTVMVFIKTTKNYMSANTVSKEEAIKIITRLIIEVS